MKANAKALHNDTEGVSPVVATLMLVLVAAASAVGLSIFMGDFQEGATDDVGVPDGTQKLSIGGSSTVYEFSLVAVPEFEAFMQQRGTPVQVDLEKGGSGAGRTAVGQCLIDIGSSSSPVKDSDFESYPDCDRDGEKDFGAALEVFQVATDGVVFATPEANTHCGNGVLELTVIDALEIYVKNSESQGSYTGTIDQADFEADLRVPLSGNLYNPIQWDNLTGLNGGPACTGETEEIVIFDRSDPGGTSEVASDKLFGQGEQKQLEVWGVTLPEAQQGDGNQGVLDAVLDHPDVADALFFTSFGYALDNSLQVHQFGEDTADIRLPTSANIKSGDYHATRPILYITAGSPSSLAQLYLDFVLNPARNQDFAGAAGFEHVMG